MVNQHLPSCPVSRNWRGEKAEFSVIPNAQTDPELLKEYGFTKPAYCWYAELTPARAASLREKIKPVTSLRAECICFNPTMSSAENEAHIRAQALREEGEGWSAGKKEEQSAKEWKGEP
ncbi:hypothetical protein PMIN04_004596 [Paraphaeosphaeria minitans]|uniref:Uncharacterized protein n=1 Tax=Paraphaeosphaeria minitans TaxID=565426 RepID=A0A9P6KU64_9PLEO|nr:hypothetical protein PMIN01_02232 [Paraphaeosphaeria minitans]